MVQGATITGATCGRLGGEDFQAHPPLEEPLVSQGQRAINDLQGASLQDAAAAVIPS